MRGGKREGGVASGLPPHFREGSKWLARAYCTMYDCKLLCNASDLRVFDSTHFKTCCMLPAGSRGPPNSQEMLGEATCGGPCRAPALSRASALSRACTPRRARPRFTASCLARPSRGALFRSAPPHHVRVARCVKGRSGQGEVSAGNRSGEPHRHPPGGRRGLRGGERRRGPPSAHRQRRQELRRQAAGAMGRAAQDALRRMRADAAIPERHSGPRKPRARRLGLRPISLCRGASGPGTGGSLGSGAAKPTRSRRDRREAELYEGLLPWYFPRTQHEAHGPPGLEQLRLRHGQCRLHRGGRSSARRSDGCTCGEDICTHSGLDYIEWRCC